MKTGLIIALVSVPVAIGGAFAYRLLVSPFFEVNSYGKDDRGTTTGTFLFSGTQNSFGYSGMTVSGRSGWACQVVPNLDGTTTFNLLKNGAFVKVLDKK